jgi:hypothetical protein
MRVDFVFKDVDWPLASLALIFTAEMTIDTRSWFLPLRKASTCAIADLM